MKYLLTGTAGFIGSEVCRALLQQGKEVVGIDNLNDYYDVQLKESRLARLHEFPNFIFRKVSVENREAITALSSEYRFELIIHLAAQAGVRYSIENPEAYIDSNLVGFGNILELARKQSVRHLVYASSSSVYGENGKQPFSEQDSVDHPVSLYAATKKANEVMAHSYSHLYGIPTTGLRFFTVYGPWGRPDMAPFLFTDAILNNRPINVFNQGNMARDFTYIDDVVDGVLKALTAVPVKRHGVMGSSVNDTSACFQVLNVGNSRPVRLMDFIRAIERFSGNTATMNFMDMQKGDVPSTYADISRLSTLTGYSPQTSIEDGVQKTVSWYREYYRL
ncbi:NAD-dependent epimerase [Gynuella sunshinyii]|uniref:Nucleoside-diphosphate-sugar epimerase n=1 Tax=Gynuella sunshinyii YC6258 TaxID=1445510 RepID=A0A0C5VLX4_9GAMM|nr:NAD-dependent epimerase [Gynuella sunshinyii]AJQ95281.1 nucleoside-diphosphate-sugar epimerase [Gynuella sunshinyii YC6258]